ncbi:MAG: sodium:proton antiporter [Deltaproteobacteria bacterium]|nr:sodium:proton antiporter [Deltaproteobacteria bacterium]
MPAHSVAPPLWTVVPFALYLLTIALFPLFLGHFWEHNRNKLLVAALISAPVVAYLMLVDPHGGTLLHHSIREYLAFLTLLGSLFIISGGVYLRGELAGTPIVNTAFLGLGALLASFVGTTGASMLLIRPLLRANEARQRKVHIVVFFIFIVSNGAGMLTPLGDPPLFLGFLRGVDFLWTLKLFAPWALVNGVLLLIFNFLDQAIFDKEELERPGSQLEEVQRIDEPLSIQGGINFVWLAGVVVVIFLTGKYGASISPSADVQALVGITGMATLALLSLATTSTAVRLANQFSWAPIQEVAVIFVGIFVTMVPALAYLEANGASLGITEPWQFFWGSGILSSFLDNAPTYLTFTSMAVGVVNAADPGAMLQADRLGGLAAHPLGALYLTAISCGSVFMGANSYIGNGPNFMVKAIAEESGVKMPSFFGYMAWSCGILVPLFVGVTFLFFRG